jgi:SAM-dependent methyltransferase
MDIATQIRRNYDRRPYPPPSMRTSTGGLPQEWVNAMTGNAAEPRHVLVAGCGVGTEAFAIAERFPEAQVVGIDFSGRAIEAARRLQRRSKARERLRFEVADLTSPDVESITGGAFDLVSCHGVLSYVPDLDAALGNIARCMNPDAVLMLGVNGAGHLSIRYRRVLRDAGIDVDRFRDTGEVRELLRVCDALSRYPPVAVADFDASYLAGDIFGPLNQALPLGEWRRRCARSGLHLAAGVGAFFASRDLINRGLHTAMLPRSRADVAEMVDVLHPASFHQLLLTRSAVVAPPFGRPGEVLRRKPVVTGLYKILKPRKGRRWKALREVTLRSRPVNTSVALRIPEWEVEILRQADGSRSFDEILAAVRPAVTPHALRDSAYLLYLLGALNL